MLARLGHRWRQAGFAFAGSVLLAALATGVLVASLATPAWANYFGTGGGGCCLYADNGGHTYAFSSLESNQQTANTHGMTTLDNQTQMTVQRLSTADGNTDAVMFDQDYTTYWNVDWDGAAYGYNYWAYTMCVSTAGTASGNCQRYEIRYDVPDMNAIGAGGRQQVGCHEVGHTVGLDHTTVYASCMKTGSTGNTTFSSHDVDHINGRW